MFYSTKKKIYEPTTAPAKRNQVFAGAIFGLLAKAHEKKDLKK
ncbi:hypothetical protein RV14_GL002157 [Enterococcus ratti]|uniref:Uncharacterized protein n=1 Tax=Enterococcus ratti TaxID=150033 RepID=A0A1L8WPD2_9ENTE|nr:hypothetical protein RV14_GL002157 [Enterococcus ratti]